jgi:hypothetical protein
MALKMKLTLENYYFNAIYFKKNLLMIINVVKKHVNSMDP